MIELSTTDQLKSELSESVPPINSADKLVQEEEVSRVNKLEEV